MTRNPESRGEHGEPNSAPRRRRGVTLSSRLAATVLGVGIASMLVATVVGLDTGQTLGRTIVDDSLQALRSAGSAQVAAQMDYYESLAEQLAISNQTEVAIEDFSLALAELPSATGSELRALRQGLLRDYQEKYFKPLEEAGETVQVSDILSDNPAALYLQANYSVPDEPISDPIAVSDAADGSDWSAAHARFHPGFRNTVIQGGLIDLYLVDARPGASCTARRRVRIWGRACRSVPTAGRSSRGQPTQRPTAMMGSSPTSATTAPHRAPRSAQPLPRCARRGGSSAPSSSPTPRRCTRSS